MVPMTDGLSGEEYRKLTEGSPVMIWRSATDGRCDYFNETWLAFTGRAIEAELGDGWAEGVHPVDLERCVEHYRTHFDRRVPFEMEYRLRRYDGVYRTIFDRGVPYEDASGAFKGFIGSCIDVHDAHESKEALARSDALLRAILDSVADAIFALDASGTIISVNPAGESLFRMRAPALIGRDVRALVEVEWPLIVPDPPLEDAPDVRATRADGTVFPAELALTPIRGSQPARYTLVVHDLTQIRLQERRVVEAADEVQRRIGRDLHDGVGQLLIGVALLAKQLESEVPKALAPQAGRVVSLINKGIEATQNISRGLAPVDLGARNLADALAELAALTTATNAVDCQLACDPDLEEPWIGTRTQLFLIAQEAVANAIRHAGATRIEIALRTHGPRRLLRISDDGRGMSKPPPSLGLGLQSMLRRARLIGGMLEVDASATGGVEVRCIW
jgi:PAS domain S-box-containing protein